MSPRSVPSHAAIGAQADAEVDLDAVVELGSTYVTTEYASLTRAGTPVTWPVTPYRGTTGCTLDVSTGLTYPLKAERARHDPRVALSFTHPLGSGLERPAVLVVQGLATVRDADLVATSRRYLAEAAARFPESFGRVPTFVLRRMAWYWTRMWIEVTPTRALWWADGDLGRAPIEWRAPDGMAAPPSDPRPSGRSSGSWSGAAPADWRERTAGVVERMGLPVVTLRSADGSPLPLPVRSCTPTADGFDVRLPHGVAAEGGAAFVSFHTHTAEMSGQENVGLAGTAVVDGEIVRVHVERALNDWGFSKSRLRSTVGQLRARRALTPRLAVEAARRGQAVPTWEQVSSQ